MTRLEGTIYCENCGVEINWAPIVVKGKDYCCKDCLDGLECACGDRMEMEDDRRMSSGTAMTGDYT